MSRSEQGLSFPLLGTQVRLLVTPATASPLAGEVLLRSVQSRLETIHRTLTRFDPHSELSLLNGHVGEWVAVSETLMAGLEAALSAAGLSDGLVDPTLLRGLERTGYARSRAGGTPPDSIPLARALALAPPRAPAGPDPDAQWRRIQVDRRRCAVRLPLGVRLDLGGSAKGMAADMAARMLSGSLAFAVDAGGDIRLGGLQGAVRTVEVAHPFDGRIVHSVSLAAGAVATSGLSSRVWRTDGGVAHHLIDPLRGTPAWTGVIQATALAPTARTAETLAKVAVLRGPLAGRPALARYGGALVLDSGEVVVVDDARTASGPVSTQRRSA